MNTLVRPPLAPDLVARFAAIVGAANAITDPAEQESYLVEERGLYHGRSAAILRPGSVDEVSAILKLANEFSAPIVPQGGNTGLVGGQIPLDGEIVLSLRRLDRIREIDPVSNTLTCEAGVLLATAQEAAAAADRFFPLSLGAEGSCTIGGNLATNAGGIAALAYGVARDLVLGLEVVLADGRVWRGLNKLKKDNTGYDLKNLFIGAEGTLGVITTAVLKLFPAPRITETAFVGLPSLAASLELLALMQESAGGAMTSFELMGRLPLDLALRHGPGLRDPLAAAYPWYVLIELKSSGRADLRDALEGALATAIDARPGGRRDHRRQHRAAPRALAAARSHSRGAEIRGRLDQARRVRAGRRRAGLYRAGERCGAGAYSGRAAGSVRAPRRRQHPFQCEPAGRDGPHGVSCALARSERLRACDRAQARRLDLGRAWHRAAQARRPRAREGPGRARPDARAQAHARPQGHPQPRQGGVSSPFLIAVLTLRAARPSPVGAARLAFPLPPCGDPASPTCAGNCRDCRRAREAGAAPRWRRTSARQPRPLDRAFAFLDPLLACSALV